MFAKLLHGLTATLGRVKQLWTKEDVPSGVQTTHDFKDGDGLVPAIPLDEVTVNTELSKMTVATTPNDILKPNATIHSMCVLTQPVDVLSSNSHLSSLAVSTAPADRLLPSLAINTMRVITEPNDILNHSLSLTEFIIEQG